MARLTRLAGVGNPQTVEVDGVEESWFGSANPMRSDIHHLFPTHKDVNATRGSDPFGEIADATTDAWYGVSAAGSLIRSDSAPSSNADRFSEDTPSLFEPPEAQKGDTARAIFYFYTVCPASGRSIEAIAANHVETLLDWHLQDPTDANERRRNDRIELHQGNRNRFVDRPELACLTWELPCR